MIKVVVGVVIRNFVALHLVLSVCGNTCRTSNLGLGGDKGHDGMTNPNRNGLLVVNNGFLDVSSRQGLLEDKIT